MPQLLAQHEFELAIKTGDERAVREQLRSQIARLERELGELWSTAFPRLGIDWSVGAVGGPRVLADPDEYRWVRISNDDVGERECKHWHSRPRWGLLGLLLNWWRVKVSSGCPLAKGPRPPE